MRLEGRRPANTRRPLTPTLSREGRGSRPSARRLHRHIREDGLKRRRPWITILIGEILSVLLFVGLIAALMLGYQIAFTLPGVALIFALIGWAFGAFDLSYFNALPLRYWGINTNEVLIAVPLFIIMGVMLERSQLAEVLLTTMGELFGELRGGLGISTIIVATLLAASTGIVGATVVTMGVISLPAMLKAGYDKKLSTGLICASGTLCQIIPPSTILVFLAVILQSAHSQAQMAKGNFNPTTLSVGDLFAGAFIPGVMLAGLYILWVVINAVLRPASAPALKLTPEEKRGLGARVVIALLPPLMLITSVLGSIIAGVATPTEAAAVGAVGAILLTLIKLLSEHMAKRLPAERVQRGLFHFWLGFFVADGGAGHFHRRTRTVDRRGGRTGGRRRLGDRGPGGKASVLRHRRRSLPLEPGHDHDGVRDLHGRERLLGRVHPSRRRDAGA